MPVIKHHGDYVQIADPKEIELIHAATLEILDCKGIRFEDPEALHLLRDHGCRINEKTMVAKIPADLIEKSIQTCPAKYTLRARNHELDLAISQNSIYFGSCAGLQILDVESMERRPGTLNDVENAAKIINSLDSIALVDLPGVSYVVDKPTEINLECIYATTLRNCEKVFNVYVLDDSLEWGLLMAQTAGTDPLIAVSSTSPLCWNSENIRGAKAATDAKLPLGIQSVASPGLTGPVTLAGSAVVMNAEILSMLVLIQLLRPGTGVLYSCFNMPFDMRKMTLASGSIEFCLMSMLSVQLSKFYGLGSMIYAPLSDSKLPDQQTAIEKTLHWQLAAMAGMNLIMGAGVIENQTVYSNEQVIIEAELLGMMKRYVEGIEITQQTLALDVINEVGHVRGTYLDQIHTRDNWRREQYLPFLFNRDVYDNWQSSGARDCLNTAQQKAKEILANHKVQPLPGEVDRELNKILQSAAKKKGITHSTL
jgi:trimethylamine--corrinoid protein Co-methyltransferase